MALGINQISPLSAVRQLCGFVPALLLSLIMTACATNFERTAGTDDSNLSLIAAAEVETLDSFEDFDDAFARAAAASVVAQYGSDSVRLAIYFDYDSSYLAIDGRAALDLEVAKAQALLDGGNTNLVVRVIGHTDERGSEAYNLALGQKRADSVGRYIITKGLIPADRIEIISHGEQFPSVIGSDEAAWSANRRVELFY